MNTPETTPLHYGHYSLFSQKITSYIYLSPSDSCYNPQSNLISKYKEFKNSVQSVLNGTALCAGHFKSSVKGETSCVEIEGIL